MGTSGAGPQQPMREASYSSSRATNQWQTFKHLTLTLANIQLLTVT